jgi:hypothetical protein
MKVIIFLTLIGLSLNLVAKTKKLKPVATKEATVTTTATTPVKKEEAPCDTKEDILKKLEEEKKKQKPFSLQGGNTGCSVDALKK